MMMSQKKARLPAEYQEVEYLQSTGSQYIDTGYAFTTNNAKLSIDFEKMGGASGIIFGGSIWSIANADIYRSMIFYGYGGSTSSTYFGIGGNDQQILFGFLNNVRYNVMFDYDGSVLKTTIENVGELNSNRRGSIVWNVNLYLFANNLENSVDRPISMKVYYFDMYDNELLVRSFIPCYRKKDSVAGLYDIVNGVFYENKGTGEFIVGENV